MDRVFIKFYANFRYTGTILIADDSEDAEFEKSSEIVKKFKSQLKIKHIQGKEGIYLQEKKILYDQILCCSGDRHRLL